MRIIELRSENWTSVLDFYRALLKTLQAPSWHSAGVNAAIDSIVWGGINGVNPPYKIRITGTEALAPAIREEIELLAKLIQKHRVDYQRQNGTDVEVSLELVG